jgi:class 3 adenylate cyclase/predicted ATPase
MDVGAWLRALGLDCYEQSFRDNEIDGEVLSTLTAEDLSDLGVTKVGHRRRILNAIAAIGEPAEGQEHQAGSVAADAAAVSQASRVPAEAERRHLTVLFSDLVGSTALSSQLDPEDMREVIRAYQDACAGVVARFEGFVAKFMGDGVLAYFGYPTAHEDEAERAVRAGLALSDAVARLSTPSPGPLAARIGIATGLVVVGDLVGAGASQEQAVVGETPNLAARLQSIARPGQVAVSESTRRLLGDGFELEDLGTQDLKGLAEEVRAFAVTGERAVESRFEARSGSVLPMVGRDQELGLLKERWSQVRTGEGQGVLLVGEAGIGKSRIVHGLLEALTAEPHTRIHYQCSPYHSGSALWPVIQQLNHAAGFDQGDGDEARLDKLEALLAKGGDAAVAGPLFADLLGLDGGNRYGVLDLTPQMRRARTLEALVRQLLGLASKRPVLVVLEDAHWIDPTTLELIEQCLDAVATAPVLVLLTSRPDNQPEIAAHPHVTRLTLNRLGRAGVEAIVARLGGTALPRETIDAIIARTDGVPLFVEELTKAILETGEATIPASLHDSLMARLDRIPEVKEVAQIAACIGREFDYEILARIVDQPEPELLSALERLTAAELIFRRGTPAARQYLFKHALVRDAAYESLLKRRREAIHSKLVTVLEQREGVAPEILARHSESAGLIENAVEHWHRAAVDAVRRPAYKEAITSFNAAIRLCRSLGEDQTWKRRELELQVELGQALIANLGYQAPVTMAAFERALALAEAVGETSLLMRSVYGLWASRYIAATPSADLADRMAALTSELEESGPRCVAMRMLALEKFHAGDYRASLDLVERALSIYDPAIHGHLAMQYGHDPRVAATGYKAWNLWHLGYPDQARAMAENALSLAREIDHPNTIGLASCYGVTLTNIWLRDESRVQSAARDILRLSEEKSLALWSAWGQIHLGWARSEAGECEALDQMERGIEAALRIGAGRLEPFHLGLVADVQSKSGRHDAAKRSLSAAFSALAARPDMPFAADLHRMKALCRIRASASALAEAEEDLQRALAIAREQGALSLELRAARDLARLWADGRRRGEARDLLDPIIGRFGAGVETPDLSEARALQAELG